MLIVYASRTGNVGLFARRLPYPTLKLTTELRVDEPYILVTYTDKIGEVPAKTRAFLTHNNEYLRGVAASGNRNFGPAYALAADQISNQYGVPIVCKFELAGTPTDIQKFTEGVSALVTNV
ncbi:class Ib ribonucleoside-diphosphate reductase assembly flavoprotein NrdI [Paenibacillus sp. UASWS1643]|uniref:class Ib ribonucleoside-diphosphate reductase assembly flavoprotein NrdI n=1 Tax=Paenibacillus sp. UASWS1643 TaxID=2580422 RepID=UPI001238E6A0|nr:class Ib ribonucleoside-diphosphate reductase assembly flavoprotein NrdI [Paenibacillus sp. UASWS1643]KAA8750172.1 class Ib ribonucleoside-diphosphate reductase assembly flavoprotein NrdI [Paenibacillus sp. UASWS1643]